MKIFSCTFLAIVFTVSCYSQTNLVNNGSFENYSTCPTVFSQIELANGWKKSYANNANNGGWHTEYVNSCNTGNWVGVPVNGWGNQSAYQGNGYIAQAPACPLAQANYRENVYTQLNSPLLVGATYRISYRVSLGDECRYTTNNICATLGTDSIFPINNQAHCTSPQITSKTNWTLVSQTLVADSAYTHLAIGNFYNDANTMYILTYPGSPNSNATYYVDSVQLIMVAGPPPPVIQSSTFCSSGSFSLSNTYNVSSVLWDFGDPASAPNNTSTLFAPTHAFSGVGTYTVTAIVQYPSSADTLTQVVTVNAISTIAGFTTANVPCGSPASFSNNSANYSSCAWDFGDGNQSALISPTHIYASAGTYSVTLIAIGPCGNDTIVQTITITAPAIDASFTSPLYGCTGSIVNFSGIGWGADVFLWYFGDGDTSQQLSPSHIYSSPGTYTVSFIASNFCNVDTVIHTITIYSTPVALIVASDDTICNNGSVMLAASGGPVVQWSGGSNATTAFVTDYPTATTTYYLTVTDSGCTSPADSVTIVVEVCLSINEIVESPSINIAPNPSHGQLSLTSPNEKFSLVTIYDNTGRLVKTYNLSEQNSNAVNIDISELAEGNYVLQAVTGTTTSTKKFVLIH